MKISPLGAELFHADGLTDSFAKAPSKWPDVRSHRALSLEQLCVAFCSFIPQCLYTRRGN